MPLILGAVLATKTNGGRKMLKAIEKLSGVAALVVIIVLGLVGTFAGGWPWLRRASWLGVAVVGAIAAYNEWQ